MPVFKSRRSGIDLRSVFPPGQTFHMPDDTVVVRNKDADEAGDYRLARHGDVVTDPNWEVTDIPPEDLD